MNTRHLWGVLAVAHVALVLILATAGHGAVFTWNGAGVDNNWGTNDNWEAIAPPISAADTTVVFKGTVRLAPAQNMADPFVLNRLEITNPQSGNAGFTISGQALEFQANGATQPVLYSSREATSTVSNPINLAAGTTLTAVFTTWGVSLNGLISGSGALVKDSGAGGLTLNHANNTFTGGITYNNTGGANAQWNMFSVMASGAMGTGLVSLNGGNTNPHDATTNSRPGGLIFRNTTEHGNNFRLLANSSVSIGEPWNSGHSGNSVTLTGQIDLNGYNLVLRGPGSGVISGAVVNTGGVAKIESGTWTLSGANTYSGTTSVGGGILKLGSTGALGNTSGVTVANGATFDFNGNLVTGKTFTIAGAGVNGQGALSSTGYLIGQVGVTLAADATIGVHGATNNRLDIGRDMPLVGNGHTLTKVGIGQLPIRSNAGSFGALQVNEGVLYFETNQTSMAGTPITVGSGATVGMYYTREINAPVTLNGGSLSQLGGGSGATSTWTGPITVNGNCTIATGGGNLRITGVLSGNGNVTVTGGNTLYLDASATVGGIRGMGAVALGSNTTLTVGGNGGDSLWDSPVRGDGTLRKVGSGLLLMANAGNSYTGGTTVAGGVLASVEPGTLGAGGVTLDGGSLHLLAPASGAAGFGDNGAGWTVNGSAGIVGNVLTVTTAGASQAGSAFLNQPVATKDFALSFTYNADEASASPADGLAIVFQTDPRGPAALGGSGGGLGYRDIRSSAAVGFNLYPLNTAGISNEVYVNGTVTGGYGATSPVVMYGTPVDVDITYSGSTLTASLTQGSNTFVKTYSGVNLADMLDSWAYLGFTGGTGGSFARQQISNFSFSYVSPLAPDTAYANDLAVAVGATGSVGLMVTPVSTAYSMGNLTMGSEATLVVAPVVGAIADIDYNLTFGATTLAGPASFHVGNNGAGAGSLSLGAVGQTSAASLAKTGPGVLLLTGSNSYTGTTDVRQGVLVLADASSNNPIASSSHIRIAEGAILDVVGLAGADGLVLAVGQSLHGNGVVVGGLMAGPGSLVSAGDSPGRLLVSSGGYRQAGLATMLVEIGGAMQGAADGGYDWIDVAGAAQFDAGAIIDVHLMNGFAPELGDRFDILTAAGGIADLAGVEFRFDNAATDYEWSAAVVSLGGGVEALRLSVVPEPSAAVLLLLGAASLMATAGRRRR